MYIRKICKIFLDFIYDNKLLPEEIIDALNADGEYCKWDVRLISSIFMYKEKFENRKQDQKKREKEKKILSRIEEISHAAWNDFFSQNATKGNSFIYHHNEPFKNIGDTCNNYFHNVKIGETGTFIGAIRDFIKYAPVEENIRNDAVIKINELENNDLSKQIKELKQEYQELEQKYQEAMERIKELEENENKYAEIPSTTAKQKIIENERPATQHQHSFKKEESKLSRAEAQSLCLKHSQDLQQPFNVAKRNSGNDLYWANPNIDVLEQNWTLLLNNQHYRQLHVIKIPANTFKKEQFYIKDNDKLNILINPYTLLNKGPLSEQCDFGKYEVAVIDY